MPGIRAVSLVPCQFLRRQVHLVGHPSKQVAVDGHRKVLFGQAGRAHSVLNLDGRVADNF